MYQGGPRSDDLYDTGCQAIGRLLSGSRTYKKFESLARMELPDNPGSMLPEGVGCANERENRAIDDNQVEENIHFGELGRPWTGRKKGYVSCHVEGSKKRRQVACK